MKDSMNKTQQSPTNRRGQFMNRLVIQVVIALALWMTTAAIPAWADEPTIQELIKQLSDPDRKVYKAAKKALLAKGYKAYRPLSKVKTDDPEVKFTIKEIMEAVKYSIIPEAEAAVRQLYDDMENNRNPGSSWGTIASKAPEKIIDLILDVSIDGKHAKEATLGVNTFLQNLRPYQAAAYLKGMSKTDRKAFIGMLDKFGDYYYKYQQAKLFYCMNDYKRTVSRASDMWMETQSTLGIELAAAAIGKSEDPIWFWGMGGRRIVTASNLANRCLMTTFFCRIAHALNKPYLVEGFYTLGEVQGAPEGPALSMFDFLVEFGNDTLIDDFLNAAQGPVLKYRLLHGFFKDDGVGIPKDELKTIIANVKSEEKLVTLADRVAKWNRADSKTILKAVLTMAPFNSPQDSQARIQLGFMAYNEGRFKDAAEQWNKAFPGDPNGQNTYEDTLKTLASELGAMADMQTPKYVKLMNTGLDAELVEDWATAEKAYRAAIALNRENPAAYSRLIPLLSNRNRFKDAVEVMRVSIERKPPTTSDLITWTLRAIYVGAWDKAEKWLKLYVKTNPIKAQATYYQMLLEEHKGNLDEAGDLAEQVLRSNHYYSDIRRQLGMIRIKQRRLKDAETLLMDHLLDKPFDDYSRLCLSIARGLDGRDDRKQVTDYLKQTNRVDGTWSTWLLRYRAGIITQDTLLKQAKTMGNEHDQFGQLCEARFSIGMNALIAGDKTKAKTYFKKTAEMNILLYIEHHWALQELKLLDGN